MKETAMSVVAAIVATVLILVVASLIKPERICEVVLPSIIMSAPGVTPPLHEQVLAGIGAEFAITGERDGYYRLSIETFDGWVTGYLPMDVCQVREGGE